MLALPYIKNFQEVSPTSCCILFMLVMIDSRVKAEYTMGDFVDYAAIRSSELYQDFQKSTSQLTRVDLDSYTEPQRKAFFISMYYLVLLIAIGIIWLWLCIICIPDA